MKKIKLLSWNVNGIRAVYKKGFAEWFKEASPDILCIQETKAWEEQLGEEITNVSGYHSFWCQGVKKGYSGTAIYTKEKLVLLNISLSKKALLMVFDARPCRHNNSPVDRYTI